MSDPVLVVSRALTTEEVEAEIDTILERPYSYVFTPDPAVGGYAATIVEFPGVFASGATFDAAHANIKGAAREWLRALYRQRRSIPVPCEPSDRFVALEQGAHRAVEREASKQGVCVDALVARILEDHLEPTKALRTAVEAAVVPVLERSAAMFRGRFPQVAVDLGSSSGGRRIARHYLAVAWPDLDDRLVVGMQLDELPSGDLEVEADVTEEYSGRPHLRDPALTVPRSLGVEMVAAACRKGLQDVCERAWRTIFQGDVDGPRVHIVHGGLAICGKPGLPGRWSDGSRHVRREDVALATCDLCVERAPEVAA